MSKRNIFDTAYWMDLQIQREREKNQAYKAHIDRLRKPIKAEETVNMETEESGQAAQIQLQKEKVIEMIDQAKNDISEAIQIQLQPPKGYILFPEPEDTGDEPTYTVQEETENISEN